MPSLRQIRRRIKSVENTKKITRAMEMVAAAKLRRYEELLKKAKASAAFLEKLLINLLNDASGFQHPLFEEREEKKRTCLVVVTSDTGLCGTYNAAVIQQAQQFLRQHSGKQVEIVGVGKTGLAFFRKRGNAVAKSYTEVKLGNLDATVEDLVQHLTSRFTSGELDEIYLLYTHLITKANYKPGTDKFLSLERKTDENARKVGYIVEPSIKQVVEELLPRFLVGKIKTMLLEASLAEHLSRMMAMRQATDNASEMIESLTLLRNKIRQASITKELIEVVSGSRAAKR